MDTPPSSVCSPCSNDVTPQPTELRPAQSEIHFGDTKNDGTTSLVGSLATGGIAAQDRAQVTFNIENNNYPSQNATRALQENAILRFSPKQLPHFTGRQTELNLMRKKLHTPSSDDDTSPLRFIMWGMAGVGKTQLVHRYLGEMLDVKPSEKSENRDPPFNTIWLKASTPEHLDESVVKILHDIQVHCKISRALRASDRRAKLRNWLAFDCVDKYSDWTLILDDVREQTLSHSRDLIPGRGAKCRVIITTRSGSIAEDFMFGDDKERCCEIKIFDVQTAQEMFWRVSKTKSRSRVEENMVADVVEAVGCLPLAIETAANRARWYTLNEVWAERKTAFDWEDKDLVSYYDDHQHYSKSRLLKNAFDCFWDLIANPETPEADLFGDISFFDSSGISVNLLERQRDQSQGFGLFGLFVSKSEAWTSSSWRDAIHRLERTSLVTQRSDGESQVLWIHNLVQALSRHQLINKGNLDKHVNGGADRLHRAVLAAHKQTGPTENSISCEEVLRHIKSILEFLKEVEKSRMGFVILKANLMNIRESVVKLLWKGGWYKAALITAEETFNARKVILGSRHGDNMIGLNIYIRALLHQGNYKKAEPLIQQAFHELKTSRDRPPEYEIECVTCLDNFAVMLRYKGDFEQAINWSNEAWIEGKSTLGPKNRYTLRCLCNLALAYQSGGYYSKAVKHSRQALRAFEQKQNILHDDDLDTSTSRHHYASALYHQGLYDDAEREIERALYARTISLGEKHPDTLTSLQNNAAILKRQGKYKAALENTQKALQGRHEMLGEDHPDTIASLDHLSSIYLCQGRYDLAEKEAQTAFARGTKAFAPEHPALLASLRNFASARRHLGHLEDAKEYYVEILVRRQEKLRLGHPDTLMSLGDTAWGEATEGYYAAAEDMYQRVYQQQCEEVGKGHPQTLASLNSVAWIRIKLGKYEAAKDAAECAWLSQEETLGMTHPDTLTTMHIYAVILQHQRLDEDAASLSQQVLAERERVLGDQHPDALVSRDSYASALRCLGQYEDAEKLCKQALLKRQELFNGSHPDVLASLDTYTLILQCQNKDSRAQALMALDGRESLEDNNLDKVRSRYNYVSVLRMEGQLAEACKEIEEVLRVQRKILGGNHPDTLSSSHQNGVINLQLERWEEAEEDLFEAFEGRKKALGVEHPDTLSSLSCYCLAIAQQRPLQEAQNLLNWELGVEEATGGLRRIKSLKDLSQNSRSVSHHAREKATEKLTKIRIAWREDALHQQTDNLKIKLARTQLKQKKGEEAVETLKFIKAHPDQSTFLRLAFLQLGKLGDALGTLSSKGDFDDEVEEVMV